MDDMIVDKIFDLVRNSNGIKASEIAKQLKISRKEVNQILYGRLAKVCVQDEQYQWYCSSETKLNETSSDDFLNDAIAYFEGTEFDVIQLETYLSEKKNKL